MEIQEEIWKDIIGYEGLYQISNHANILISTTGKIKKQYTRDGRYLSVNLTNKDHKESGFSVHRLTAKYFVPNPLNLPMVNHKDLNKRNNYFENLEWCTCSQNIKHAIDAGAIKPPTSPGNTSWNAKPVVQFSVNMNFVKEWDSAYSILQVYKNMTESGISNCCHGRIKCHQGFIFKLKTDPKIKHLLP